MKLSICTDVMGNLSFTEMLDNHLYYPSRLYSPAFKLLLEALRYEP